MWQGCRHEQRVLPEPFEHGRTDFFRQRMAFGQLQIVLGFRRLVPGGDLAVRPLGLFQSFTDAQHFLTGKQARDVQEHGVATQDRKGSEW
jgi:hypothetical protein